MVAGSVASIRFPQAVFSRLRRRLLDDSPNEAFAVLLAKSERVADQDILKVLETRFAGRDDYLGQGSGHVRLSPEFTYDILCDLTSRLDADTIIDVHTHPFASGSVSFSSVDDRDEIQFRTFLAEKFPDVKYGSIVLSQSQYAARIWDMRHGRPNSSVAMLRTQTTPEAWPSSTESEGAPYAVRNDSGSDQIFSRTALAVGVDVLRRIMKDQRVAVVGVGGLGSIIAENLVHMGFHQIHLIDPDVLEISNLSRVAGATYRAAQAGEPKVEVVAAHLRAINPDLEISTHRADIADGMIEPIIANCDWILVATDNHSSRLRAQMLSVKYFVPLMSAGVNISVRSGRVTDVSGEVITSRIGDGLCLNCLGRLNAVKIASESHPSADVRDTLVVRGYVTGADTPEPAVKTLNSIVGSILVDVLINQYTGRQPHMPIIVFENNTAPSIYPDSKSVAARNKNCFTCGLPG